jgi:hypothetical protein
MQTDHTEPLRLAAKDEADLEVVSALLQDAIIAGADMHYDAQHESFMIVANRFCWERPALADMSDRNGGAVRERALCGLRINHVTGVQKRQWPKDWRDAFFSLLALKPLSTPQHSCGWVMELSFSGGPLLRLIIKQINIILADLDSGRPTNLKPRHDL